MLAITKDAASIDQVDPRDILSNQKESNIKEHPEGKADGVRRNSDVEDEQGNQTASLPS